jgi:O-antigen/teichoic acid export membrane protein
VTALDSRDPAVSPPAKAELELPVRYSRTVASDYARTILVAVLGLATTPLLVRHLGAEGYGIWVLVGSIALYLELLEFGFGTGTIKYVAEAAGRGDTNAVRRTTATSFWVLAAPGALAFLIGVVLAVFLPTLFHLAPGLARPAQILLVLVVFDLAVSIPSDTFGGTLIGLQRFDAVNVTMIAVTAAQALAWWLVLAGGGGLALLGAVTVAISLSGQAARFLIARHYVHGLTVAPREFERARVRPLAGLSAWYALLDLSRIVVGRIDVVVVALVVGVPAAGIYAVGQKLALAAEQVVTPVTKAFMPHSSALAARSDSERLRATILGGTRISLAIAGPICLAGAILAKPLIVGWVGSGSGFAEAAPVLVYLLGGTVLMALSRTGLLTLQGIGDARRPALIRIGEAALNLGLSVLLGRLIGVSGVALATLLAAAVSTLAFMLPLICRRFGISTREFAGTVVVHLPPLLAASAVGVAVRLAGPTSLLGALAGGTAIVVTYLVVFTASGLERRERALLRARLRRLVGARA